MVGCMFLHPCLRARNHRRCEFMENVNGLPVEAFESLFSFSLSPGGLEDGGHGTR